MSSDAPKMKYYCEVSYYQNPNNKKVYSVLREEVVDIHYVQDALSNILEKISRGRAGLRSVIIYDRDDPEGGLM